MMQVGHGLSTIHFGDVPRRNLTMVAMRNRADPRASAHLSSSHRPIRKVKARIQKRPIVSNRRRGAESSATRAKLIDAAKDLLRDEGYAAVSTRRVAEKLGLKRQIVHYYFHTVDALFVAVIRRDAEEALARLESALASDDPLRAVWELNSGPTTAALAAEVMMLAKRRPAVQEEVKGYAERFRSVQTQAVIRYFELNEINPGVPAIVATVLMTSISQVVALEHAVGISLGHSETLDFVRALVEGSDIRPRLPAPARGYRTPAGRTRHLRE